MQTFPRRLVTAFAAVAALAVAGCSSSGGSGSPSTSSGALSGSITVAAASSLTEAFDTIKAQFTKAHPGTKITISYGASSDLATQITNGAPIDVFASASTSNMDDVKSEAINPVNFVTNTMEIATPPSNPANISSVTDLAKPGVKVAVCSPEVPCGVVATEVFKNAKITVKPAAEEEDVKSTLAAVESGEVDAGMVYVTDVRAAGDQVKGVEIPDNLNASTEYPIAALKGSKNPDLAKAFVDYVLSPDGKNVLADDGFSKP
jgi:molybdate transport system substrate-binding protein